MHTIKNFEPTQELLNNFDKNLLKLNFKPTQENIEIYDEILSFFELLMDICIGLPVIIPNSFLSSTIVPFFKS